MLKQERNAGPSPDPAAAGAEVVECPSCHAALARGLRFCRMCGYRLGEGVEEYAATRHFDGGPQVADAPPLGGAAASAGPAFQTPHAWGAITPSQPYGVAAEPDGKFKKLARACNPARFGWVFWIIVIIVAMTVGAATFRVAQGPPPPPAAHAVLGVDGFETAPTGGAFIQGIDAPGTPAEAAGLAGGDVITSFDGRSIANADDMRRALRETPIGKAVEVVYLRDGVTGKTTLIVGASDAMRGWADIDMRPGGKGRIGIDDYDRVQVPGRNIYGVRVDDVDRNGPADLFGMKEGDIVVEFDGRPVRTTGDLRYLIYKAVPGSVVKILVVRGGVDVPLDVKIGRSN